jgi:N-acetylglucosamine kinase-like BadF-type ATPase
MSRLFLGVDGGQSHTDALVADDRGRVLGRGRGGPSNHADEPGGRERLRRAVRESVGAALAAAGLPDLRAVRFVVAHCAMTGGAADKIDELRALIHADRLGVGHDAPAALAGATGGAPGIVVIAGTGSVAYGETGHGRRATVGGWGYLVGDEGGAFWIALEAIRRAARAEDALAAPTRLGPVACRALGCSTLRELAARIHAGAIDRAAVARLAPEVEACAADDAVAAAIVEEAGRHLAALAVAVADRLGVRGGAMPVVPSGGVSRLARLSRAFAAALAAAWPQAQIAAPRFDAAVGALLLAYREAGLDLPPRVAALEGARLPQDATS